MRQDPAVVIPGLSGLELIGRGGYGMVYRATDVDHARTVAVKVLTGVGDAADAYRALQRERTAIGRLSGHPHIVVVYASGLTEDGQAYVIMDYVGGGSLADQLRRDGPMPPLEAAALCVRVSGALHAAHGLGVIHRDVKPANILRTPWGEPKLADFGIARLIDASTQANSRAASLAHASPEVLDGKPATPASDVYSLASTLHHLIAGSPPFAQAGDESILPMIARIASASPPRLRDVPDALADAVVAGLAKDPHERPRSAEVFGQSLQAVLHSEGVDVPPMVATLHGPAVSGAATDTTRPDATPGTEPIPQSAVETQPRTDPEPGGPLHRPRSGRFGRLVAVTVGAIGVVAVLLLLVLPRVGNEDAPVASTSNEVTETTSEPGGSPIQAQGDLRGTIAFRIAGDQGALVLGLADAGQANLRLQPELQDIGRPALSPDGTEVAVPTPNGLEVLNLADGDIRTIHPGSARDPAWAPDGQRIVFAEAADGQQDLFVIDAQGGTPTALTGTAWDEGSPAWSPDGITIAFDANPEDSFAVFRMSVEDPGSVVRIRTGLEGSDETPSFDPSGERLVLVNDSPSDGRRMALVLLENLAVQVIDIGLAGLSGPTFSPDGEYIAFTADAGGNPDLHAYELSSTRTIPLLTLPDIQSDPSWGL